MSWYFLKRLWSLISFDFQLASVQHVQTSVNGNCFHWILNKVLNISNILSGIYLWKSFLDHKKLFPWKKYLRIFKIFMQSHCKFKGHTRQKFTLWRHTTDWITNRRVCTNAYRASWYFQKNLIVYFVSGKFFRRMDPKLYVGACLYMYVHIHTVKYTVILNTCM